MFGQQSGCRLFLVEFFFADSVPCHSSEQGEGRACLLHGSHLADDGVEVVAGEFVDDGIGLNDVEVFQSEPTGGSAVAGDGWGLPIRAELFQLHDRGIEDAWRGEGNVAWAMEDIALPSVWRARLRSRSAARKMEKRFYRRMREI